MGSQLTLFGGKVLPAKKTKQNGEKVENIKKQYNAILTNPEIIAHVTKQYDLYFNNTRNKVIGTITKEAQEFRNKIQDEAIEKAKTIIEMRDVVGRENIDVQLVRKKKLNLLLSLPTSFGKTLPGVASLVYNFLMSHQKGIITGPVKALCEQHAELLSKIFQTPEGESLVIQVTGDTRGDYAIQKKLETGNFLIIVTTTDKLDIVLRNSYLRNIWGFNKDIGAIVVDEIHNMKSGKRGSNLESAIKKMMLWSAGNMIVGLSATAGSKDDLKVWEEWLGAQTIYVPSDKRPLPLDVKVMSYYGGSRNNDSHIQFILNQIMREVKTAKWIGFVRSQKRTKDFQEMISQQFPSIKCKYHNAGLRPAHLKKQIIDEFNESKITGIVATTTIAQGVDTPCQVVIIIDSSRWNGMQSTETLLEESEFKQMAGRVRYAFKNGRGLAIAICKDSDYNAVYEALTVPKMFQSQIPNYLREKIIEWCVSGINTLTQMKWMITDLFNYKPDWNEAKEDLIWVIKSGFITVEDVPLTQNNGEKFYDFEVRKFLHADQNGINATLVPTIWAKTMARYGVLPETIIHIRAYESSIHNQIETPKPNELYVQILNNKEFKEPIVVRSELDETVITLGSKYLEVDCEDKRLVKAFAMTFKNYIKMREEKNGNKYVKIVSGEWDEPQLTESSKRMFICARDVFKMRKSPHANEVEITLDLIEGGSLDPKHALLSMIDQVGPTRLTRLRENNVQTIQEFAAKSDSELISIMGTRVNADLVTRMKNSAMEIMEKHKKLLML